MVITNEEENDSQKQQFPIDKQQVPNSYVLRFHLPSNLHFINLKPLVGQWPILVAKH
jgi:hypothetical protein